MIRSWAIFNYELKMNSTPTTEMIEFLIKNFNTKDRNKAQEHLIKLYDGMIISIVKKYIGRGIDFDDLYQAGKLGLLHSASKYDSKKSKFSTYSTNWIRQYCLRTIENNGRNVRLPNHIHQCLSTILKYGIDLPIEELEVLTGIDKNKIITAINGYHTLTLSFDDIKEHTYTENFMLSFEQVLDNVFDKLNTSEAIKKAYISHYDAGIELSKLALELNIHEHILVNKFRVITNEFTNYIDEESSVIFDSEDNEVDEK